MRKTDNYDSGKMKGIVSRPVAKGDSLLILLHGVGANEKGLVEVGEMLSPESIVVSLRAPIVFGASSFAWFHVQFTPQGNIHNWEEANQSFELLEKEIETLSKTYNVPLNKISVMGFSQGSIMTMGLLLRSSLPLSHYLCFSGRTLPEFENFSLKHPEIGGGKKVYLTHGAYDAKMPITMGRKSKEILERVKANVKYHEFPGGHEISREVVEDAAKWLKQ